MAKVIFEFEVGEEDDLIALHHNAPRMAEAIDALARELRAKTKHAMSNEDLKRWLPFAKMFKDCVSSDLYSDPIPTDYTFDEAK